MKKILLFLVLSVICLKTGAQVSISNTSSTPDVSAMLDVSSTTKGMLVPRMSAAQRDAISNPANGLLIFCTDNNQYYFNNGTPNSINWVRLNSQWYNNGTSIYYNGGNVGIGITSPAEKLDVDGAIKIGTTSSICDAAHRGTFKFVQGGSGTGDEVCVCRKLANDYYVWDRITFSGSQNYTCDNFDRPNSTVVSGWTEQNGNWAISSNRLQSEALSEWQFITNDGSTQADGSIATRVIYPPGTAVKAAGIVARYSSNSINIMAKLQDNSGTNGYFDSYFIYSNNGIVAYATGLNFGTDAIIQLTYSGTSVVFKIDTNRDGIFDFSYSATVSNTDPGLCGVSAYSQCTFDNWCYETTGGSTNLTCDYFEAANSTVVPGWTEQYGNWAISSNRLQSETSGQWQFITNDGSTQADGCITTRVIYPPGIAVKAAGIVARYSSNSVNIMAKLQDNSGINGYFDSYFIYSNNGIVVYGTGLNFGTDANIQLSCNGSNVVFKIDTNRDGTYDHTYSGTVSNTAAGLCGVSAYNQCFIDNWCYGTSCP